MLNFIDFTQLLKDLKQGAVSERKIVGEVAFLVIEQTLGWLSSLTEDERETYTGAMDDAETSLSIALLKSFYLSRPEIDRQNTASEALRLLNAAWETKSALWISQRWDALSRLMASISEIIANKYGAKGIGGPVEQLMKSFESADGSSSRWILINW